MSFSTLTSANCTQRGNDLRQLAVVVDRDRHADFGSRHDVDSRADSVSKTSKQPTQEPVRHQHTCGGDLDDGDAAACTPALRRCGRSTSGSAGDRACLRHSAFGC